MLLTQRRYIGIPYTKQEFVASLFVDCFATSQVTKLIDAGTNVKTKPDQQIQ